MAESKNTWRAFFAGTAVGASAVVALITNTNIRNRLIEIARKEYIRYKFDQFKGKFRRAFGGGDGSSNVGDALAKQGENLAGNLAAGADNIKHAFKPTRPQVDYKRPRL